MFLVLIALPAIIAAVIIGVILLLRGGGADAGMALTDAERAVAHHAIARARRRALAAVGLSIVLFVAVAWIGIAAPQLLGLPLGLAPGIAVSGGLLLFAATPSARIARQESTSASLDPRAPWSFGRRGTFALPLTVAGALIAFLVWTGISSSPDENGLRRTISLGDATSMSTASPYPGWFYGLPLILVTVALAVTTMLALARVSTTPSMPAVALTELDRRWREASTRVITHLSTAALLGYFGGTAFIAGQATHSVATVLDASGYADRQPESAAGITMMVAGAALAATGLVFLVLAAARASGVRSDATRSVTTELRRRSA